MLKRYRLMGETGGIVGQDPLHPPGEADRLRELLGDAQHFRTTGKRRQMRRIERHRAAERPRRIDKTAPLFVPPAKLKPMFRVVGGDAAGQLQQGQRQHGVRRRCRQPPQHDRAGVIRIGA